MNRGRVEQNPEPVILHLPNSAALPVAIDDMKLQRLPRRAAGIRDHAAVLTKAGRAATSALLAALVMTLISLGKDPAAPSRGNRQASWSA